MKQRSVLSLLVKKKNKTGNRMHAEDTRYNLELRDGTITADDDDVAFSYVRSYCLVHTDSFVYSTAPIDWRGCKWGWGLGVWYRRVSTTVLSHCMSYCNLI
jgi:hypothetical protein